LLSDLLIPSLIFFSPFSNYWMNQLLNSSPKTLAVFWSAVPMSHNFAFPVLGNPGGQSTRVNWRFLYVFRAQWVLAFWAHVPWWFKNLVSNVSDFRDPPTNEFLTSPPRILTFFARLGSLSPLWTILGCFFRFFHRCPRFFGMLPSFALGTGATGLFLDFSC